MRKLLGAAPIPTANASAATSPPEEPAATTSPASPTREEDRPPPLEDAVEQHEHIPVSPILPPSSKAKGKQKANPPDPKPDKSSVSTAQQAARDALRKKKQEEKEELARIKARIEADKRERKAAAEAQKAERQRLAQESGTSSPITSSTSIPSSKKGLQSKDVHLNVRMFDGQTIRSTFPRTAKLEANVRPWIDQEFAARAEHPTQRHPPYFFKQILAPLPSRELSAGDENETLGDIELAPSATLVLVPIKGYTEAYSSGSGGVVGGAVGAVTGLVGGVFGVASSAVGLVGSTLGSIVGYGGSTGSQDSSSRQDDTQGRTLSENRPSGAQGAANIRVRTLADQREGETRPQEFYNGNQLSFEPNEGPDDRR